MHSAASGLLDVVVESVHDEALGIRSFVLVAPDGRVLPPYQPGAHIDVALPDGLVRSYSLIGPLDDPTRYRIAVMLDPRSRGGSTYLHQSVGIGSSLRISAPRNNFELVEDAATSVLIAGGIGITPLWCMVQRLAAIGASWQLHYACRTRRAAAFTDEIVAVCRPGCGSLTLWFDDEHEGRPVDVRSIVRGAPSDAHLYCCGPAPMLGAFRDAVAGESSDRVHLEYFRPTEVAKPACAFVVELARTGVTVDVPAGCSILDALMMRGIDAPYSCYEGVCGTCETRVIEGIPDHRDNLLSDRAKAENKSVIICRSGSLSKKLILDL